MGKTWVECRLLTFQIRAQWVSEGVSADANGSGKLLQWDKMTRACNLFVLSNAMGHTVLAFQRFPVLILIQFSQRIFYFILFYSGFSFYKFLSGE